MNQPTDKQTAALLIKAFNYPVQVFYYFPDIVLVGGQRIEREEFDYLYAQGYLCETKMDSFGKFYRVSKKAEKFVYDVICARRTGGKKRIIVSNVQGALEFVY